MGATYCGEFDACTSRWLSRFGVLILASFSSRDILSILASVSSNRCCKTKLVNQNREPHKKVGFLPGLAPMIAAGASVLHEVSVRPTPPSYPRLYIHHDCMHE